jgi:hypothetical protein
MSEYWIWNNHMRGWRGRQRGEFTLQLHMAGRFAEHLAVQYVKASNEVVGEMDYPVEVMVQVNNTFLTREAQKLLIEYEKTGDRKVIDAAYFAAQDKALVASADFQESWAQMLRGEGRKISPSESTERTGT